MDSIQAFFVKYMTELMRYALKSVIWRLKSNQKSLFAQIAVHKH